MIDIIEEIADYKVERKYLLDKPKGVRGRSSDNRYRIDNTPCNFGFHCNLFYLGCCKI
jgi:hypothetical protein